MLLFPKDGIIAIRSDYYPGFTKQIKKIPGAVCKGWEWHVPEESLPAIREAFGLVDAHFFPYLRDHIDTSVLRGVTGHLNEATEEVILRIPPARMEYLVKNLEVLCGYEEITEQFIKGKGKIYSKKYVPLMTNITQDNVTLKFKMPLGLATRLAAFLKLFPDTSLTYTPRRDAPKPILKFGKIPSDIELREYQVAIQVAAPKRRCATIVLPTGAGKTITAGLITHGLRVPTLFLTYSSILLYQTKKSFEKLLGVPVGIIGDGQFDVQEVTVATVQSILSVLAGTEGYEEISESIAALQKAKSVDLNIPITAEKKSALISLLSRVQLLFIDEGHQLGAKTIYTAARLCKPYYCYALTATPHRTDNKEIFIEAATGPVWRPITEEELIKLGYVLPVKVGVVPYTHPEPNQLSSRRDSAKLYTKAISANAARNERIVKVANKCAQKYKTLVLVKEIAHGMTLAEALNTAFVCASTPADEKQRVFNDFAEGKIQVLVSSPILEQGVDIPAIELILDATPRKSPIKILQTIGRARRPGPGKTHAYVVTIYDNDKGVYEKQSARKLDILKQANFEIVVWGKTEQKTTEGRRSAK